MFESLRSLSDSQIITGCKISRAQEHSGLLAMIGFIAEIERRELFLRRGYSSLFDYCMKELGYSESQAMRRIVAARCANKFPEAFELLKANEINLGTISRVSKILTRENCHAVLQSIRKKSLRQVEAIIAEHAPIAAFPRDRVRTIVARAPVSELRALGEIHLRSEGEKDPTIEKSARLDNERADSSAVTTDGPARPVNADLLTQGQHASLDSLHRREEIATDAASASRHDSSASDASPISEHDSLVEDTAPISYHSHEDSSAKDVAPISPHELEESHATNAPLPSLHKGEDSPTREHAPELVAKDKLERRVRVEFTARQELMEKLERVRAIASHRLPPGPSIEQLIDFMADYVIHREDPLKRHERRQARQMKRDQAPG